MTKRTLRTLFLIMTLSCLLYYTIDLSNKFQKRINDLTLELEERRNHFQCQIDSINEIYQKEFCISPLKSLSLHLTNINSSYGLSPFIDYKKIWDENSV